MRYSDRTRTILDWNCPRARYHAYEHGGLGLAPMQTNEDLLFGIAMAEQTANIKRNIKWSIESFAPNMQGVAEVLCIGYEKIVWPRWMKDYDLVEVEAEKPKQLTPWLVYNSRPDTIVRRKSDGTIWYGPEDKTTKWVDSLLGYAKDVQLHATALCTEDHLSEGQKVAGALVQGLYKGFVKEGKLYHPLVMAYYKEGIPGIMPDQWSTKYVRGWDREDTKHYPGGREAWILKQPDEIIAEVFPMSPPILLRRDLVEVYFKQLVIREQEINDFSGAMESTFPQHFNNCDNFAGYRRECDFKPLCWAPSVAKYPLTMYKPRAPHHQNEIEHFSKE